ncbi:MAG TPA: hypothetical protein VIF62_06175 [Labilithrix sp.]|jgi:hypothetical protein
MSTKRVAADDLSEDGSTMPSCVVPKSDPHEVGELAEQVQHIDRWLEEALDFDLMRILVLQREAMSCFVRRDWAGARAFVEMALELDPESRFFQKLHAQCASAVENVLRRTDVLTIACPLTQLASFAMDPRTMFILSRLDGTLSLGTVLEMANIALDDVSATLVELLARGAVRRV